MRDAKDSQHPLASLIPRLPSWRAAARGKAVKNGLRMALCVMLLLPGAAFGPGASAQSREEQTGTTSGAPAAVGAGDASGEEQEQGDGQQVMQPTPGRALVFSPINVREAAAQQALSPSQAEQAEIRAIHPPGGDPRGEKPSPELNSGDESAADDGPAPQLPAPAAMGSSPGPSKSFIGLELTGSTIPPDTMGAVGTTHIVTATNDRMRIHTRDGVILQTLTLNSFWSSVLIGGNPPSTFDPKIYFDRFNNRFIYVVTANAQNVNSATLFAVSQTADPTGVWFRYGILASDAGSPANTATTGRWADYPSVGHNKNWITIQINMFGYGTGGTGYRGPALYVIDKQAAYAGPGSLPVNTFFQGTTCTSNEDLGCGFTMAPSIAEDNTSETMYLLESWNSTSAILRLGKIIGTPSAPLYDGVIQHPQARNSWRASALNIGTSGGYQPQRQLFSYAPSGNRIMANDARIQNVVLRNGRLWAAHTVMIAATPTAPGTSGGNTTTPDVKSAVQWWEIDPSQEPGVVILPAIQAGRVFDPTADNCHNGGGAERTGCTLANQVGQFFSFPTIAVNKNNEVLIGFTMASAFTFPNGGYVYRAPTDPVDTTRDPVVFRAGQATYSLGSGSGTARQNRWGDYSATMVEPVNDTDFWTTQEYSESFRQVGSIGVTSPWSTWWTLVRPNTPQPVPATDLLISEFRLRGKAGANDEYIKLYNPASTPVRITTADNSEGWAVGFDTGTTQPPLAVIPVGTVIPARGHYLVARNPDATNLPGTTYSLTNHPNSPARATDSDGSYHLNIADNQGVAVFRTANRANFSLATRVDAAGFNALPVDSLYKEGAGIPALPTTDFEYALVRKANTGTPQDTNDNAADFRFVDPAGTLTAAGQNLGAPGPQNVDSPFNATSTVGGRPLFTCVGPNQSPNRERNLTPVPNGSLGTLAFRRIYSNYTGLPVRKLRFRIVDTTTFPAPAGVADLRAISSGQVVVASPCGTPSVTVEGTQLEEPPAQPFGGGFNATLAAGTITFANPLAVGDSIILQLVTGVEQTGAFRFLVIVEAVN
jgi:hypothetical protein